MEILYSITKDLFLNDKLNTFLLIVKLASKIFKLKTQLYDSLTGTNHRQIMHYEVSYITGPRKKHMV